MKKIHLNDPINDKDSLGLQSAFLEKPFKLDKLHEVIRRLII